MEKLIFIVDDTFSILTMAANELEDDYRVMTMASAEKMFSMLLKMRPDLILLDIEMPDITGFEALAKLKENPEWSDIRVVFLTGFIDDSVLARVSESGALGVMDKSEISTALLSRVKECLE